MASRLRSDVSLRSSALRNSGSRLGRNLPGSGTGVGLGASSIVASSSVSSDGRARVRRAASLGESHIVTSVHVGLPSFRHARHHHHRHARYFSVCYPYYGYFWIYPFAYLDSYGCDYYSWYSVRYGSCRLSLYSSCSHLGYDHSCGYAHHCHRYQCGLHGWHYYRVRDCGLCYPVDVTYYVDLGDRRRQGDVDETDRTTAADKSAELAPAELSFCEGWSLYRAGRYDDAVAALHTAALELPTSGAIQYLHGLALLATEEYELAHAAFLTAFERFPEMVRLRWDAAKHHVDAEASERVREQLRAALEVEPADHGLWCVDALLSLLDGDLDAARRAAGEVLLFDAENALAQAILGEVEASTSGLTRTPSGGLATLNAWLADPNCAGIPGLDLGSH
ncbi:MAG: tetratricopeptide repeat protein [Planctomycetota bacterium]